LCAASNNLFYDDAPWLDDKVSKSDIPLLHPQISSEAARSFGVRPLSTAIKESCADVKLFNTSGMNETLHKLADELKLWEANLNSPEFQGAVRRAIEYSKQTGLNSKKSPEVVNRDTLTSEETSNRIFSLSSVKFALADEIKIAYLLDDGEGGRDVTKKRNESFALALLQSGLCMLNIILLRLRMTCFRTTQR
jgi:hypothetical protein